MDLGNFSYPIGRASLGFGRLHPARSVGDVRKPLPDAGTEQFQSTASPGGFDDGRAQAPICASDALGNDLGERIDRRRSNGAHLGTGFGGSADSGCGNCDSGQSQKLGSHFE